MQPPPIPRLTANGKIVSIAQVFVKPGKEARMRELLFAIAQEAREEEQETLTYRITEALGQPGAFLIFEEYTGQSAVEHHYKGRAFSAMGAALGPEDILDTERGGVLIDYYEEF